MVRKNIVLILGAGASKDYGFPLGIDLLNRIKLNTKADLYFSNPNSEDKPNDGFVKLCNSGFDSELVKRFHGKLNSPIDSIDLFLELNPKLLELGKCAISQVLIPCELKENLFFTVDRRRQN